MSVKIKVSYTEDEELCNVLKRLSPDVRACKIAKKQTGKYKRAFVDLGAENQTNRGRTTGEQRKTKNEAVTKP